MFADRAALDKYAVSDAHVKVVTENVKPNVDGESSRIAMVETQSLLIDVFAYDFELDN